MKITYVENSNKKLAYLACEVLVIRGHLVRKITPDVSLL